MITISNLNKSTPYAKFNFFYEKAKQNKQDAVEAIALSSFNNITNEVESRFVNLKYIIDDEFIFFSNYQSLKSQNFDSHNQISALLYWHKINVQIRIKAKIKRCSSDFSNNHFLKRSNKKNALAISSSQSQPASSYEYVQMAYQNTLSNKKSLIIRPSYWGGFSFTPYYFEFWEGHKSRVNIRNIYKSNNIGGWDHSILQP